MNALERCQRVINHQIPDRVPVDLHNFLPAAYYSSRPMSIVLQDGEFLAEAHLEAWREFGHDMLLVENGVIAEAGACGCQVEFFDDGPPRVSRHVLAEGLEKIAQLRVPDPLKTPPMSVVIEAVKILSKELRNEVFIMGRADQGPGALALALRGYEQFLLDLAIFEQPELISKILDYCVKVQARYALALREAGAHGTSTGGLGLSLLNPGLYRRMEQVYEKKFIQLAQKPDYPVALHICGDATPILGEMVETGAKILELDAKTDMRVAKETLRKSATFLGPISPELIWGARNTDAVTEATQEAIKILAPGGEFILGPGCALGYDTPKENIHALVESAKKFGRYKSDGSIY